MSEDELVWEKLDAVDGDTQYFTYDFLPYTKTECDPVTLDEDLDLQRALEESASSGQGAHGPATPGFLPPDFLSLPTDVPQGQQLLQPVQKRLQPRSTSKQTRLETAFHSHLCGLLQSCYTPQ